METEGAREARMTHETSVCPAELDIQVLSVGEWSAEWAQQPQHTPTVISTHTNPKLKEMAAGKGTDFSICLSRLQFLSSTPQGTPTDVWVNLMLTN